MQEFPKVAIVHYWLVGMRGGERVLEAIIKMFPNADIFTHVVDRSKISDTLNKQRIFTTFIAKLPFATKLYQLYLPLMPLALEQLDLSEYDLVISSESGPAKGVITRPDALHICYCHSPMRYLWDHYHMYRRGASSVKKMVMFFVFHYLRIWDQAAADRVDVFVANSSFIARRILKYYRRNSEVVHPPVAVEEFSMTDGTFDDYYLWAGQLVSYKRPDLAILAFNKMGKRLVVVGDGEERHSLSKIAEANIEFVGSVSFSELKRYYQNCRALIFPGEEDFGIVPVEVQASGRPVIAFGRGGVLDTIQPGVTGAFFHEPTVEALVNAVKEFENGGSVCSTPDACRENAIQFSEAAFVKAFSRVLNQHGIMLS